MINLNITKISIYIFLAFSSLEIVNAQDLIYSQFNAMPLAVNPAFAGNNTCNYRLSAIGRKQWMGVQNAKTFESYSAAGDFNLNNIYDEKYNIWGVGAMYSYDKSGLGTYKNQSFLASLAYHTRFGNEGKNFLSFGMQAGMGQRGADMNQFTFTSELDAFGRKPIGSSSGEVFQNDSKLFPELGFGSMITLNPNENTNMYFGAAVHHLLSPNVSFTNEEYRMPIRTNFHAGGNFVMGGFLYLPSVYFQMQQVTNYNIGTYVGTVLVPGNEVRNPTLMYLGLWYKSSDAITPAMRMDIGRFSIAASYDIHIGGVSQNLGGIGSPEISINFYGCFGRSSKRTGCPSL